MSFIPFDQLPALGVPEYSKAQIRRLEKAGRFPRRVQLGGGHKYFWIKSEIEEWIAEKIAERDRAA